MAQIRILFLTEICPYPPSNGGAIKTFNILKHLGSKHQVSLFVFVRDDAEAKALGNLKPYCHEVAYCAIHRSGLRNVADAVKSLFSRKPFIISRSWRPEMQSKVLESLGKGKDLIYVDHLQMFQYAPESAPCPVLLDQHNVEWRIIRRLAVAGKSAAGPAARLFASREWRKLQSYELASCRAADQVLTVTSEDRDTLISHGVPADKVTAVPIGADTEYFTPLPLPPQSRRIITFGTMSWPPNIDAVTYFAESIYPLIKREVPDATLSIIGARPPERIKSLADTDPSIEVTGFVKDIREAAGGSAVSVVPLRAGSGMRVKIVDAMAMGLPVVTTSVGCEGISLEPGKHALVEDSPERFAAAVVHLLNNPQERVRLGEAGRRLVESQYSWPPIMVQLDAVLSRFER